MSKNTSKDFVKERASMNGAYNSAPTTMDGTVPNLSTTKPDKNIDAAQWAQDVGDAIIAKSREALIRGSLNIYQEGLEIGQRFALYDAARNIDAYYTIQTLTLRMIGQTREQVTVEYGNEFESLDTTLTRIKRLEQREE